MKYMNKIVLKFENAADTNSRKASERIKAVLYLRVGSKPVLNSGQWACADVPAGVSGQQSQPSHVPLQNFPKHKEIDIYYNY